MLKKLCVLLVTTIIALGGTGAALAGPNPDNGPGCGLGKLAWSDYKGQKEIAPQVMMATTNGTFGSTTFGISSGTSGCTNDGQIMSQEKVNVFAAINFENLSQEMAQGRGEHLVSLATLMGIPEGQHEGFFEMTQQNYSSLVNAGETSPAAVIRALNESMAAHPVLAKVSTTR